MRKENQSRIIWGERKTAGEWNKEAVSSVCSCHQHCWCQLFRQMFFFLLLLLHLPSLFTVPPLPPSLFLCLPILLPSSFYHSFSYSPLPPLSSLPSSILMHSIFTSQINTRCVIVMILICLFTLTRFSLLSREHWEVAMIIVKLEIKALYWFGLKG